MWPRVRLGVRSQLSSTEQTVRRLTAGVGNSTVTCQQSACDAWNLLFGRKSALDVSYYWSYILYHNLPNCQLNRLQQIQNSLSARAVVKAPKSTHITPILNSLHWLKVNERIEYKLLSLTYKVLTTAQTSYLHDLISLRPPRSTRSSSVVTLSCPPTISSLKVTDR